MRYSFAYSHMLGIYSYLNVLKVIPAVDFWLFSPTSISLSPSLSPLESARDASQIFAQCNKRPLECAEMPTHLCLQLPLTFLTPSPFGCHKVCAIYHVCACIHIECRMCFCRQSLCAGCRDCRHLLIKVADLQHTYALYMYYIPLLRLGMAAIKLPHNAIV